MDWKLGAGTFLAIFIAEMGDKTQLAAFAMASGSASKWTVFFGASLALIATTAIAVLAGGAVGRYLPELWLKRGAGLLFVGMGILLLMTKNGTHSEVSASPPQPGEDVSSATAVEGVK